MAKTKKEIDKDVMYAKLMPSSARYDDFDRIDEEPAVPEEPDTPPSVQEDSGLAQLRNKLFGTQPTQAMFSCGGEHSVRLINLMENLIVERLDDAFSKFNCCRCDRCRMDVVAIALNKLPTKYAVGDPTTLNRLESKISTKAISSALVQAILVVRANPRH